jgi:hypothetical protein
MEPWEIMYVWIDDDSLNLSCCKRGAELSCVVRVLTREPVLRHAQNTGEGRVSTLQIRIQNVGMRFGVMRLTEKIPLFWVAYAS